jgi:ankyrin repeat protein
MLKTIKEIWQYIFHIPLNFLIWMDIGYVAPYRVLHYLGLNINFKYNWLPVGYGFETRPILIALKLNSTGALKALREIRPSCRYSYYSYEYYDYYITKIFEEAARANDFKTAKMLVDAGHIDIKEWHIYKNYEHKPTKKEVRLLLDCGANPNLRDYEGNAALHYAVYGKDIESVKLLLKYGADVNSQVPKTQISEAFEETGYSALHYAVRNKNIELVQILLSYKANPNLQGSIYGTALHGAIRCRNIQVIKLLCDAGANLNIYSYEGYAPIHEAAFYPYPEGVKMLLSYDPTQALQTYKEGTLLHNVVQDYHQNRDYSSEIIKVVRLLLAAGASINAQDSRGKTPLFTYLIQLFYKNY